MNTPYVVASQFLEISDGNETYTVSNFTYLPAYRLTTAEYEKIQAKNYYLKKILKPLGYNMAKYANFAIVFFLKEFSKDLLLVEVLPN